jgi:L-ornithine N5-oxygenase
MIQIFDPSVTHPWYHSREHVRSLRLKEFASTNYGVNSHSTLLEVSHILSIQFRLLTLFQMFEIIYDQKLDDAAAARNGAIAKYGLPRLAICNYSTILAAEAPEAGTSGPLTLTIRNALTGKVSESKYDVLICATGYERSSWVKLFANTDLAAHYGVHSGAPEIELIPDLVHDEDETSTPSENGSDDTAITTPPQSVIDLDKGLHVAKVRVSRNYRLVPAHAEAVEFKPRIYVQGLEERTHGISDTLLSVIGIRAGEIVNDLYSKSA